MALLSDDMDLHTTPVFTTFDYQPKSNRMGKSDLKGNESAKGQGLDKNKQNINKTGKNRRSG